MSSFYSLNWPGSCLEETWSNLCILTVEDFNIFPNQRVELRSSRGIPCPNHKIHNFTLHKFDSGRIPGAWATGPAGLDYLYHGVMGNYFRPHQVFVGAESLVSLLRARIRSIWQG